MHWNYEPVTLDEILKYHMTLCAELAEKESEAKSRAMSESFHRPLRLRLPHIKSAPLTWDDYKHHVSEIDPDFKKMLEEIQVEISPNPAYVETEPSKQRIQQHCFSLSHHASVYYLLYLGLSKGQILRFKRMQKKLNPVDVAEQARLSIEDYLAYENDEADLREIKADALFAIARTLDTPASDLIEDYKV